MKNGTINNLYLENIVDILSHGSQNRPNISRELEVRNITIPRTTLIRILNKLISEGAIITTGSGRATTYSLPSFNPLLAPVEPRSITTDYHSNPQIFDYLHDLFTSKELDSIPYRGTLNNSREIERYIIDFAWKSSAIEGNTYTHFDTLNLLTRGQKASNKTSSEAQMILNHKDAIQYIFENPPRPNQLTLNYVLHVHSLLTTNLDIGKGLRNRQVGISGTTYIPPKPSQLEDYLITTLRVINKSNTPLEQAIIALSMISYLQPFEDGNKRTARLISNSILIGSNYVPPSYFTVNERDFLMAILIFYEQNTILPLKKIFIDSCHYAATHYFAV